MKKILVLIAAALMLGGMQQVNAQFFKNLVDKAGEAAKKGVENRVTHAVENGVDKALDPDTYKDAIEKGKEKKGKKGEEAAEAPQATEAASGWTCPECGRKGNTGKFCADCGAKQPAPKSAEGWTCPECGHQGNTGKFCGECGAKQPGAQATAGWTCPECGRTGNTGKFCDDCGAKQPATGAQAAAPAAPQKKTIATEYSKSDFVPGDEVFFEDLVEGERVGEFPSKWDLVEGNSEVAVLNGQQVIVLNEGSTRITPLMKTDDYLGDVYTLEFDFWGTSDHTPDNQIGTKYYLEFNNNMYVRLGFDDNGGGYYINWYNGSTGNSGDKSGDLTNIKMDEWNHLAVSFNQRAFKVYINGERVVAVPNATKAQSFTISNDLWETRGYIKNIRLAKGAVPLYDRLMSDGKIITYAITFETGKADLKPESEVEINRIAKLMQENPNLSFEVQGHCDATGSDKVNDPLSQKRAEAIVAALVDKGIAAARLTAVGKGSHEPIASNSTDEGRAKNRRVEFVKK